MSAILFSCVCGIYYVTRDERMCKMKADAQIITNFAVAPSSVYNIIILP